MTSLFPAKASSTRPAASSQGADGPYALLKLRPFPPCFRLASLARTTVYGRPSPDSMSPSHPQPFQLPSQPSFSTGLPARPVSVFSPPTDPPGRFTQALTTPPGLLHAATLFWARQQPWPSRAAPLLASTLASGEVLRRSFCGPFLCTVSSLLRRPHPMPMA